jgi:hypothetical protein
MLYKLSKDDATTLDFINLAAKHNLEHALKHLASGDHETALSKARLAAAHMRDAMELIERNRLP